LSNLYFVGGIGLSSETMTSQNYYFTNGLWGPYESKINLDTLNINSKTDFAFLHTDINGRLFHNKFLAPFSLALGIRQSHHSLFGNTITYEINPTFKLTEDAILFTSYSTGFNAPSLYELFSPSVDMFSNITRGNKNLKPETSRSIETGIKQKFGNTAFISVSYFNSMVQNAIEYVYLWNKTTAVDSLTYMDYKGDVYLNMGSLSTHGIELSVETKINNHFFVSANVTLVSGKLNYDPSLIDTAKTKGNHVQLYSTGDYINKTVETIQLVRRPSNAMVCLNYTPCKRMSLALDVKYNGAKNDVYYNSELGPYGALGFVGVKDYTLIDFTAKANLTKFLSAIFKVENLLDEKYTEIYGFTTKGRGFYLSLRFQI